MYYKASAFILQEVHDTQCAERGRILEMQPALLFVSVAEALL